VFVGGVACWVTVPLASINQNVTVLVRAAASRATVVVVVVVIGVIVGVAGVVA
jgi:hypothetical protein